MAISQGHWALGEGRQETTGLLGVPRGRMEARWLLPVDHPVVIPRPGCVTGGLCSAGGKPLTLVPFPVQ